jgi:plasmid stabilization system protein ParE
VSGAPVRFLPAAQAEVREAHAWYESRLPGLGERFVAEVDRQVERLVAHPGHFPFVLADVRRAVLRTFPYSLLFREANGVTWVLACFHASRDPLQWQGRL